jgi:5-formyltetrahydrofolate cyclo-ligase
MRKPLEVGDAGWRRAQRRRLIAARLAMAPGMREAASQAIERALTARFPPGAEALVGAYWPIQGEFDPLPYLTRCLEAGAKAALPAAAELGAPLEYRPWTPGVPMETGRWDILHPAKGPAVTPSLLIVPLLGFDAARHRLGYGGGFFDRTLALVRPRPKAVGLGFEAGRLPTLSPLSHDQPMDVIITEAGVFEAAVR